MNIIQFIEKNADGCGTNIDIMIKVYEKTYEKVSKQGNIQKMLENTIEEIKQEWDEWETDPIIKEACDRVFGPFNWEWESADCIVKF